MRLIERLQRFIDSKHLTANAFEEECDLSNGYIGKQHRGKGTVGSDILERIHNRYPELNLMWLITGKGNMLVQPNLYTREIAEQEMQEEDVIYQTKSKMVTILKEQLDALENAFPEKKKRKKKEK